jgi:hypothetical protein
MCSDNGALLVANPKGDHDLSLKDQAAIAREKMSIQAQKEIVLEFAEDSPNTAAFMAAGTFEEKTEDLRDGDFMFDPEVTRSPWLQQVLSCNEKKAYADIFNCAPFVMDLKTKETTPALPTIWQPVDWSLFDLGTGLCRYFACFEIFEDTNVNLMVSQNYENGEFRSIATFRTPGFPKKKQIKVLEPRDPNEDLLSYSKRKFGNLVTKAMTDPQAGEVLFNFEITAAELADPLLTLSQIRTAPFWKPKEKED